MSETDMRPEEIRGIVEALLMTADTPITPGRLQAVLKGLSGRDIRKAIDDLNEQYRQGGHAMSVVEIAGGFQVATRREFGPWVRKLHDRGRTRLTQAGLETLAIIAFKQPLTRIEVDGIRGVESGGVIRTLLEANMIRLVGRSESLGRPMLFGTTREFMSHFGLKSLADLPKTKELQELLAQGEQRTQADDDADEELPDDTVGSLEEAGDVDADAEETLEKAGDVDVEETPEGAADLDADAGGPPEEAGDDDLASPSDAALSGD